MYRSNQAAYLEECLQKGIEESACSLFDEVINAIKSAKLSWLLLVMALFMLSNLSRARRWQMMLHSMEYSPRYWNVFWSVMLGYFINLGIPRSGEFVRAGTLGKYENIPVEKVMGTVVQDRILDVLCLLICIGLTFLFEFHIFYDYLNENFALGRKLQDNKQILFGLGISAVLIGTLIYWKRKSLFSGALGQKISKIIQGFSEGLLSLKKVNRMWEFIFHTVAIWLLYYLMNFVCFFSYEPTSMLGPGAGLVSFVFGAIGIVFPSPGGMGSYHFLVQESLQLYGIERIPFGFSFAMIAYVTIQIICNVTFGILSLILLPWLNRKASKNEIA